MNFNNVAFFFTTIPSWRIVNPSNVEVGNVMVPKVPKSNGISIYDVMLVTQTNHDEALLMSFGASIEPVIYKVEDLLKKYDIASKDSPILEVVSDHINKYSHISKVVMKYMNGSIPGLVFA